MGYGEAMKQQRLAVGKTLSDIARETGISHQNLSRWENDKALPSIDFCVVLAKYYGITIEELIGVDL